MRSATSFFNKTIFKNDYRRYWPLLFVYTLIWVVMPITQWNSGRLLGYENGDSMVHIVAYQFLPMALFMAVLFGCLMAMAVFSYLMNSRSVGLMHALPIRRSGLFLSHVSAALSMFVAGNLIVTVMMALVQITSDAGAMHAVLVWFLVTTALDFIFFSLAVFCCLLTGWLLAVPVLYIGANVVAPLVTVLVQELGGLFYYGYDGGTMPAITGWLTPVYKFIRPLSTVWYMTPSGPAQSSDLPISIKDTQALPRCLSPEAVRLLWIYAAAALVLLIAAGLIYRRRASESAGDPVAVRCLKPVFRYGLALLGGLGLGLALYLLVTANMGSPRQVKLPILLVCLVLMGGLCYFAMSMIIEKSFRVFGRRGWLKAAATAAVLVVLCFVMRMDLTGYETRLPAAEEVETVTLHVYEKELSIDESTDAQDLALVQTIHQEILRKEPREYDGSVVLLEYRLKDGSTVCRRYYEEVQNFSAGVQNEIEKITNSEANRRSRIIGRETPYEVKDFTGGNLYTEYESRSLSAEAVRNIYAALEKDLRAGAGRVENTSEPMMVQVELNMADGNTLYIGDLPMDCKHTQQALRDLGCERIYWSEVEMQN